MMTNVLSAIKTRFFTTSIEASEEKTGLNAFYGVFLPSLLSIFGVIMYLRLGAVVGNAGIVGSFAIILFSSMITFITALSISATATNSDVGSGGAYYMISRAFGIEIGSAIGVALFLAQVIGIAFFIEGFSESVSFLFPKIDSFAVEGCALFCLTALTLFSASAALKAQLVILMIILASMASVFAGSGEDLEVFINLDSKPLVLSFWATFALFFPAVTGIEAGFSMSGDLKSPKKALPIGTIAAVITGLVTYMVLSWHLWRTIPTESLINDPMVILHSSKFQSLVIMGIWGATISSAIGALLGAPRTLQALAKDGIVPRFLGRGFGEAKEPRNATAATFFIAGLCLFFGDINIIAPVLAMFFLISYGMLNLAAGIESFLENPSWRPTFAPPWYVSMAGAFLCLFAMLMIDAGATFISLFVVASIYTITKRKNLSKEWEDIHQGTLLFFARFAIYRLANQDTSLRSWRPNFLVFSRSPTHRPFLLQFASSITNNKGFMTTATLLASSAPDHEKAQHLESLIKDYLKKKRIQSLVEVNASFDTVEGMKKIVTSYGLGPIAPNTIVIGHSNKEAGLNKTAELIAHAYALDKSVIIIKDEESSPTRRSTKEKPSIDIWWDDNNRKNNDLMMLLAHMLGGTSEWRGYEMVIKCVVPNENAREMRSDYFENFFSLSRLDIEAKVLVVTEEQALSPTTIPLFCGSSAFLFVGLPAPEEQESYVQELQKIFAAVKSVPRVAFVLNSNEIRLDKIFQ